MVTAPVPRPSTTVLLVRDGTNGLEVLMVVRNPESHYSSALVFPGGVIDAEDADDAWLDFLEGADGIDATERTRRVAGLRELHEETGLLLLDSPEWRPDTGRSSGPSWMWCAGPAGSSAYRRWRRSPIG